MKDNYGFVREVQGIRVAEFYYMSSDMGQTLGAVREWIQSQINDKGAEARICFESLPEACMDVDDQGVFCGPKLAREEDMYAAVRIQRNNPTAEEEKQTAQELNRQAARGAIPEWQD